MFGYLFGNHREVARNRLDGEVRDVYGPKIART
jgi:hypothetical protein